MPHNKLRFYTVKSSAIFIMACIYFIAGSVVSILLDEILSTKDIEQRSTLRLAAEIMGTLGLIAVSYYFLRIFIKRMPFFLDGLYGFQLHRLDEASGGIIIAYVIFMYQDRLSAISSEFEKRMTRWVSSFIR